MRYEINELVEAVLAQTNWSQRELTEFMGCGKNSLKAWLDNGAPFYIVLALQRIEGKP